MWFGGGAKVQVRMECFPAAKNAVARLTRRRMEFGAPLRAAAFGDGGFADIHHTCIICTRGNLYLEFRIAGPLEVQLDDAVHALDEFLTARTPAVAIAAADSVGSVDLSPYFVAGLDGNTWYRVYSPMGQVQMKEGKQVYLSDKHGTQTLIFFEHADGKVTRTEHTVDVP